MPSGCAPGSAAGRWTVHSARCHRPIAPLDSHSITWRHTGLKRYWWQAITTRRARAAAAARVSASRRVVATGFSHSTWKPFDRPHSASSRCVAVGVQMSMKSIGPKASTPSRSTSGRSASGATGAASITPTICRRSRTVACDWYAGKCAPRATPPAPTTRPRYWRGSADTRVAIGRTTGLTEQRGGLRFLREDDPGEHDVQRRGGDPGDQRRPTLYGGQGEQHEAEVLAQPGAPPQQRPQPLRVRLVDRAGHVSRSHRPHQPHRAWEEERLTADVVAVQPRAESRQARGAARRGVFREIELAALPVRNGEEGMAHEIDRRALQRVTPPRDGDQQHSAPAPVGVQQPDEQMSVEADEAHAVARAVEQPPEAARRPPHPGQLAVGAVEDVGDDEQRHADEIHGAAGVIEEVTRQHADEHPPDRHLVRRDGGRSEGARETQARGPEKPQVDPLLDGFAFMR